MGDVSVALEKRLNEFTKKDRYCNFQIKLIREGNDKNMVYVKYLKPVSEEVKLDTELIIEHNSFISEFDKIIYDDFKLDWMCD